MQTRFHIKYSRFSVNCFLLRIYLLISFCNLSCATARHTLSVPTALSYAVAVVADVFKIDLKRTDLSGTAKHFKIRPYALE